MSGGEMVVKEWKLSIIHGVLPSYWVAELV